MNRDTIRIRAAVPEDGKELLKIYAPYVEKTAITFEYTVPELRIFRERIENTLKKYPYLVAEKDGELSGYAYTSPFVGRAAYGWAAEVSIYIREDRRRTGVGKRLYQAIEEISRAQNILNLNACISSPETEDAYLTKNSIRFHCRMGYKMVGEFHKCGYKFGRWYNMVWMEKIIGEHMNEPLAVIPFPQLFNHVINSPNLEDFVN
ncbi:MAG: GNAT family N-acetyltransferase [Lachnospiraceae bacterium]|nr:GNAT family N-acetyltransferase [Lachnospiraceae bacterium]